jgi:hypothetical protein
VKRLPAIAIVLWSAATLAALTFPGGLDYGEGPIIDQAARLLHGEPLYRWPLERAPWVVTNYPPLYMALVAGLARVSGAALIVCGRLLTAAAALSCALLLRSLAARLLRSELAGGVALFLFLLNPAVLIWSGYVRVDLLALAFALAAMRLVLVGAPGTGRLIAALLCLLAATATKQTYALAAPIACIVSLAQQSRPKALWFAAAWALLLLALLALAQSLTDGGFARHVLLANANEWNAGRALHLIFWGLVAAAPSLLLLREARGVPAAVLAFLVAGVATSLLGGKVGSHVNYLLEADAALALAAAGAVSQLEDPALLLRLALVAGPLFLSASALEHRIGGRPVARALNAAVAAAAPLGPVLSDEMVSLGNAGVSVMYQPFEMHQFLAGAKEPRELLAALERHEISLVVLEEPDNTLLHERWSAELLATLGRSYRRAEQLGDFVLYRPR